MRKYFFVGLFFMGLLAIGQNRDVNYDETLVPSYVLPEVLRTADGDSVTSVKLWREKRRPELMKLFSENVYGVTPNENLRVRYRVLEENDWALNGMAYREQVEITFYDAARKKSVKALLIWYLPRGASGEEPVFVGYNYMGNESIADDPTIIESPSSAKNVRGMEGSRRGLQKDRWPLEMIISRGFGVATMCYNDIFPDKDGMTEQSVLPLFSGYEKTKDDPASWQAISAWAWGMSRMVDYLAEEKGVDPSKFIAIGHSRHGKAALWAGAQDERFAMVVSNNSGCGGAAISRRKFGETTSIINNAFPHWFCRNFSKYNGKEEALPVDQHQLIALMAPRHVYIASASQDLWADPRGEYLAGANAGGAYSLWGLEGLTAKGNIGWHLREGGHNITAYDWDLFMSFAERNDIKE